MMTHTHNLILSELYHSQDLAIRKHISVLLSHLTSNIPLQQINVLYDCFYLSL